MNELHLFAGAGGVTKWTNFTNNKGNNMYHLLCYSDQFKESHIGTTQETLAGDLFGRLGQFFKTDIHKVVVVETRETILNPKAETQLELF